MCIFCAAVPMSAAIGASIAGKQHQHQQSEFVQINAPKPTPVGKITVAVTGGLIVCSAMYHLVIAPHMGITL
jgi:hypothetical protein